MAFTSRQVLTAALLNDLSITTLTTTGTVTVGAFTLPATDGSTDQVLVTNGSGTVTWQNQSGGGTPGGSDGQVQYNNGGAFGGASGLHYDDGNARLGIGTTSPDAKLEVADGTEARIILDDTGGTVGAATNSHVEFQAGGSEAGYVGFSNVADGTMRLRNENGILIVETLTNNYVAVRTNNTTRMTVTGTGDVGIGTANPNRLLDLNATTNSYLGWSEGGTEAWVAGYEGGSNNRFIIYGGTPGGTKAYRIVALDDGNVGIGETAPAYKLEVNGTGAFMSNLRVHADGNAILTLHDTGATNTGGYIEFESNNGTALGYIGFGNNDDIHIYNNQSGGQIFFRSGGNWRAYFTSGGDFLPYVDSTYDIGSTSRRWAELHADDGFFDKDLTIGNSSANGNATCNVNAQSNFYAIYYMSIGGTNQWHFETGGTGTTWAVVESGVAQRLTVDATRTTVMGQLRVGGTSGPILQYDSTSTSKLDINDPIQFDSYIGTTLTSSSNNDYFTASDGSYNGYGGSWSFKHDTSKSTSPPGNSAVTAGRFFASNTSVGSTSDRRLKKNIEDFDNELGLHILRSLRPRTFEWDYDDVTGLWPHGTQIGLVAQEVDEVFPAWVDYWPQEDARRKSDGEIVERALSLGLDQQFQVMVVSAIQNIADRLEALESA